MFAVYCVNHVWIAQDQGEARSRAGGGQTQRPVSDYQRRVSGVVPGTLCVLEGSFQSAAYAATSARRPWAAVWRVGVPPPPPHQPSPVGSASATPPQGGSDTGAPYASLEITPPLRGSRREGGARSRAGGGQTRRPVSDDQRHYQLRGGGVVRALEGFRQVSRCTVCRLRWTQIMQASIVSLRAASWISFSLSRLMDRMKY